MPEARDHTSSLVSFVNRRWQMGHVLHSSSQVLMPEIQVARSDIATQCRAALLCARRRTCVAERVLARVQVPLCGDWLEADPTLRLGGARRVWPGPGRLRGSCGGCSCRRACRGARHLSSRHPHAITPLVKWSTRETTGTHNSRKSGPEPWVFPRHSLPQVTCGGELRRRTRGGANSPRWKL